MRTGRALTLALSLMLAFVLAPARHAAGQAGNTGGPPAFLVTYPAGWNIVAVTQQRPPFFGLGYTLQAGDSDYEVLPLTAQLQPKVGYWAYFRYSIHIPLNAIASCEVAIPVSNGGGCRMLPIPVPAGQWIMIGDPLPGQITVTGADAVYTYDPTEGDYVETTTLQFGQGAFVYSSAGGMVTISSTYP